MKKKIYNQIKKLPCHSGIYKYYDKYNQILYIGKSINIKKRVESYFYNNHSSIRIRNLVSKIFKIKFIITNNENDALLLENNLIKKFNPKYNIKLKDDKNFVWICIKKERFPKIFITYNLINDGSQYYGPYKSIKTAKYILKLINDLYPLRTCDLNLSRHNIIYKKYKVCFEYYIKNCKGPCEGLQSEFDYMNNIKNIKNIINGNFKKTLLIMNNKMKLMSANLFFEKAQIIKKEIDFLKKHQSNSIIVNYKNINIDFFSIISNRNFSCINFIKTIKGNVIECFNSIIRKKNNETEKQSLLLKITYFRKIFFSVSKEICTSIDLKIKIPGIKFSKPKKGYKKKIIEISIKNAMLYFNKFKKKNNSKREDSFSF